MNKKSTRLSLHLHKMTRLLACLPFMVLGESLRIESATLAVTLDPSAGTFQLTEKASGRAVITNGSLLAGQGSFKATSIDDPTFGKGHALHSASGSISLFNDTPFAVIRAILHNPSPTAQVTNKVSVLSFSIDLGQPSNALSVLGTGGLSEPSAGMGSHAWLAVADPQTRHGIVAGWVTHHRASGVLFPREENGHAKILARADYGCLRLGPGTTVPMEMLVIGSFPDARLDLEAYADLIAAVHHIKLPPQPAGHCTWYHAKASNERDLPALADFSKKSLAPFGHAFIQIDDGWQSGVAKNGPAKDFSTYSKNGPYKTQGMKGAADTLRQQGYTPGLWLIPFAGTEEDPAFAERKHWFVKRAESDNPYKVKWGGTCLDLTMPEVQTYLRNVIHRIVKEWGFTYLKLDGLWTGMATGIVYVNDSYKEDGLGNARFSNPEMTHVEAYRKGLKIVREAAGSETFILGCNVAQNMRTYGASFGLVDAMRVGPDNAAEWFLRGEYRLLAGPKTGTRSYFLNRRVWYNDPDPVFVRASMPLNHAQLIGSWVALAGQLVATSDNLSKLPPERLDILRRIMPAHQATARPVDLFEEPMARIWSVSDTDGEVARQVLGLYNWDDKEYSFQYDLERIGLTNSAYTAFDYWGNRLLGTMKERLAVTLPAQSCLVLSLRPVTDHPQLLSTSRHVTQGMVDVRDEKWDAATRTLSGRSLVVKDDPYELRIVLPEKSRLTASRAVAHTVPATLKQEADGLLRITFPASAAGEVAWSVTFSTP